MARGFEGYSPSRQKGRDESGSRFLQMGRLESNPHTSHLSGEESKENRSGNNPRPLATKACFQ